MLLEALIEKIERDHNCEPVRMTKEGVYQALAVILLNTPKKIYFELSEPFGLTVTKVDLGLLQSAYLASSIVLRFSSQPS